MRPAWQGGRRFFYREKWNDIQLYGKPKRKGENTCEILYTRSAPAAGKRGESLLLKSDLNKCKDLPTVERLAEQFRWYAPCWTPEKPALICSDEQFDEFAKALGRAGREADFLNLLYFLALAAQTEKERKNRADRILEQMHRYEPFTDAELADYHSRQLAIPPAVRMADALDTIRWLAPPEPEEDSDDAASNRIACISARDLQDKEFQPVKWVVEGLLPQGLALLVSPPKFGKSWFALDLCLSVAAGQRFLDMPTNKSGCFYLALEDNQRRLQERMNKVLEGERAPEGFEFATASQDLSGGLTDQLVDYLALHPGCGLIVIDTLQKVRRSTGKSVNAYEADYKDVGALQRFASERNICIVLVHHLRKLKDENDPFSQISGTNGILGAADTALVMNRTRRSDDTTNLAVTGRDVESFELALQFDKALCRWQNLGDAETRAREQAREEYENSALVQTIRKLVERSHGSWSGTAREILEAGRLLTRRFIADSPRGLTQKLNELNKQLLEVDGIIYKRTKNGSGGGTYHFYRDSIEEKISA